MPLERTLNLEPLICYAPWAWDSPVLNVVYCHIYNISDQNLGMVYPHDFCHNAYTLHSLVVSNVLGLNPVLSSVSSPFEWRVVVLAYN